MNHLLIIQCIWHSIFKLPPFSILHKYWSIQLSNHSHPVGKVFSSNQIDEIKSSKKRLEYQVGKYLMSGMCLQQYLNKTNIHRCSTWMNSIFMIQNGSHPPYTCLFNPKWENDCICKYKKWINQIELDFRFV